MIEFIGLFYTSSALLGKDKEQFLCLKKNKMPVNNRKNLVLP